MCGCGTHIFLNEEEIFVAKLTSEFCKKTVREIRKYDVPVLYEAADAIYFDKEYSEADKWKEAAEKVFHFKGKDIEEVLESDTKVYDKVLLILKPSQKNERLKKYLSEDFTCIDRSNDMYEMIQKNYSKGTGIHFLCEYLGKTIEDCYAFGDSENDRAMLEAVVHSVAMGNGEEAIKKSCSYIAEDIEEDGLYKAMQHFGLLGEISN